MQMIQNENRTDLYIIVILSDQFSDWAIINYFMFLLA